MEYLIQVHGGAASAAQVGALSKEFKNLAVSEREAGAAGATAGAGAGKLAGLAGKGLLAAAAGMAAVGVHAVKMSNTFNTEMLKIRTEGGATSKEFNHMKSALLDMASSGKSLGAGPESLAKGLYHLEGMNIRGSRALLGLKLAAQEAAISGADLEQTTTSLGGALFIAAKGTGTMTQTMAALNAIAASGNMRFQDLNEALGTGLLGSAKIAGISLQEMGAALAVLTDSGYHASSAGAQLGTALHFLYAPTAKAQTALKAIGLTGSQLGADLRKPQGILAALKDLKTHMGDLSKSQQANVLNSILPGGRGRVLLNLFQLQNRLGPKYGQIQGTRDTFPTHVMEQARNQATRLAMAHARLQAGMVRLGNVLSKYLTPALISLEHAGAKMLGWVIAASPVIVKFAKFVIADWVWWLKAARSAANGLGTVFATFGQDLFNAGKAIMGFLNAPLKLLIGGWDALLGRIQPVISAIQTVANLLPSLPPVGGGANAQQPGSASQLSKPVNLNRPLFPTPKPSRGSQGIPPILPHAAHAGGVVIHQHTGDFVVHVAGKEWARITRREMQKSMMAGG